MTMTDYLNIYLRDQHAMGVVWRDLARRAERNNHGTPLGTALSDVADGIAEDVRVFETIMRAVGTRPDRLKTTAGAVAERLARLKPNGHLRSYSPLSRFLELDALVMGIEGKKILWRTLRDSADLGERLPDVDFARLLERAEIQRQRLDAFHTKCARETFGVGD